MRLIAGWRSAWRFWSVRIQAACILVGLIWEQLGPETRAALDHRFGYGLALVLGAGIAARLVQQGPFSQSTPPPVVGKPKEDYPMLALDLIEKGLEAVKSTGGELGADAAAAAAIITAARDPSAQNILAVIAAIETAVNAALATGHAASQAGQPVPTKL